MQPSNICYFVASPEVCEAVAAFHAAKDAHVAYMTALAAEYGLSQLWHHGGSVVGFSNPDSSEVPAGFRRDKRVSAMLVPYQRTVIGRQVRERMSAAPRMMPVQKVMEVAGLATGYFFEGGTCYEHSCGWYTFGDTVVLTLHADERGEPRAGVPQSCRRIPDSGFWAMKEAHERAEATAPMWRFWAR